MLTYEEEDHNHHHETHHRQHKVAPVDNRNLTTDSTSREQKRDSLSASQADTNVTTVSNDLGPEESKENPSAEVEDFRNYLRNFLTTYYPNGERDQEVIRKMSH